MRVFLRGHTQGCAYENHLRVGRSVCLLLVNNYQIQLAFTTIPSSASALNGFGKFGNSVVRLSGSNFTQPNVVTNSLIGKAGLSRVLPNI
jgi:hypothetical protein